MLARGGSYILGKFAASFWAFTVFEHTYAPRRYVRRIQANDASVVNFDIKTKPVGAEHAARGIKSHRSGDEPMKVRPCADHETFPDILSPRHAADQRIIEETAFKGHSVRNLAQLQELKQDRDLGQIGDDDPSLAGGNSLQFDVQFGRPFAFEFLAGEGKALVGSLGISQCRARKNDAENARNHCSHERDVVDQAEKCDAMGIDRLHLHRTDLAPRRAAAIVITEVSSSIVDRDETLIEPRIRESLKSAPDRLQMHMVQSRISNNRESLVTVRRRFE